MRETRRGRLLLFCVTRLQTAGQCAFLISCDRAKKPDVRGPSGEGGEGEKGEDVTSVSTPRGDITPIECVDATRKGPPGVWHLDWIVLRCSLSLSLAVFVHPLTVHVPRRWVGGGKSAHVWVCVC